MNEERRMEPEPTLYRYKHIQVQVQIQVHFNITQYSTISKYKCKDITPTHLTSAGGRRSC